MKQLPEGMKDHKWTNASKIEGSEEGGKYRAPKQTNGWISRLKNVYKGQRNSQRKQKTSGLKMHRNLSSPFICTLPSSVCRQCFARSHQVRPTQCDKASNQTFKLVCCRTLALNAWKLTHARAFLRLSNGLSSCIMTLMDLLAVRFGNPCKHYWHRLNIRVIDDAFNNQCIVSIIFPFSALMDLSSLSSFVAKINTNTTVRVNNIQLGTNTSTVSKCIQ